MINIGLQHFRLVRTIVQEGSITKAAEILHLTQSALSHQLKELEKELKVPVFYRRGKKMLLSDEGQRFLCSAEKILTELSLLEEDLADFRQGRTGCIKISTQCYTAYHWLPAILHHFKQSSPGVSVQIMSEATVKPLDFLVNGELDVGIVRTKSDNTGIYYEPIFEDQLLVVMHKHHPLAQKDFIEIADFQNEELFLAFADPATGNVPVIGALMQMEQVQPKKIHYIHYTDAIIEMLHSNLGISIMADWIVTPYLKDKDIVLKPMPASVTRRTWYAAACKDNPAIRNFMLCLKEHFPKIMRQSPVKRLHAEPLLS